GFTLVFIPALGLFFISDLLGGGRTIFLGNLINSQVTKGRNRPLASAFSVGMILMILVILFIYGRVTKDSQEGLF
ncbi:MAG TPA: spermidine/putrescine ABC transporter permease PotB, partial [Natronincola sp.]|nr:spermidine/putrescine ABC transporter permease PotB [Natronincola sp.]